MGINKFTTPPNNSRNVYTNVSNVRLATVSKSALKKITTEEIKSTRISAYKYLLP